MPVRHITGLECLSSPTLPTPNTMEHREVKTPEQIAELKERSPGGYRNLREVVINELDDDSLFRTPSVTDSTNSLLPTPLVDDAKNTGHNKTRINTLAAEAYDLGNSLLATPVASEGTKAPAQQTSDVKSKTGQVWLSNQAKDMEVTWGKFEAAIRRWEQVINRPAPAPTKPDGKEGSHRLSSEFTEWMMGLPAGWITGVGLKRNDELKACGNGVVPQQAELALRMLLQGVNVETQARGGA